MCVCLSVCLSVCYRSSGGSFHSNAQTKVQAALVRYSLDFRHMDFCKNASFRSYGVICLPRKPPALLQDSRAHSFDDTGL